jgi:hypothetical protein
MQPPPLLPAQCSPPPLPCPPNAAPPPFLRRPAGEVAADPYACGGLWNRFRVEWEPSEDELAGLQQAAAA